MDITEIPVWFIDDQLTNYQKERLIIKWEVYEEVKGKRLTGSGNKSGFAIKQLADKFHVCERTIWKYVYEVI